MGAQSIKIPVELELRQLQGSINTLQNALNKLDPGSKIYKSIEGSLFKLTQRFNSLEAESKKSFGSVKEINSFEQKFNKVNDSVQELAYLLNKVSFEDLGQIFSDSDLKPIEEARNKIKQLQSDLANIKTDKMNELANSSKDFKSVIDGIKGSTFKDKLGGLDREISSVDKTIENSKENIQKYTDSIQETRDKIDKIRKISTQGFDFSQFLTADKKKFKGNQNFRGKEQLSVALSALGYDPKTINEVIKVATSNISEAQKLLQAKTTELINKNNNILKVGTTAKPALEILLQREEEALKKFEAKKVSLENARTQLKGIELDPSTQQSIDILNQQIEEQTQIIQQLKIKLLELSGIYDDTGNVIQDSGNAFELSKDKIDEARASMIRLAEAQEKLDNVKHAIKNWFGFNEVINMSKNAVRNAITHIRELDKTMTEIAIVTDMTQQQLWGQIGTYSALAQQYGATTKGVYEVSQLYYQQGLQTAEVMDLTSETLKMARISSLSYSDATDYMTVALRGFKLEMSDAQNIVDVYSNIAAVSASDTEELAVAMSKTASSAEAVGASFENTTAMIALMVETTREAPENIGSAMKSIISRYGEMTSDPMKLVDSEGEEMSLNKVDKALQSVGISLQDAQGQFRNFDDVILELAESWDTIDKNTQRYIATVMAGNRQQSRFLALVGNYERLKELTEEAANSEDAAQLQILKTMDSIETKLNQLKVTYQEFYTNTGVEELVKGVLDSITSVIENLNNIPKTFEKIPVAALIMAGSLISVIKLLALRIVGEVSLAMDEAKKEASNKAGEAGKTAGQKFIQNFKNELSQLTSNGKKEGLKGLFYLAGDTDSSISQILRGITTALTTTSFLIDQNTRSGQGWAGSMQIVSGILQGIQATSMAIQGSAGWVGFALTAITTVITGISTAIETTEEKIERLSKEAQEASNQALLTRNNYKNLDSSIKKLEQLKEERYDSVEAAEEYKTAVDDLANQYPELIKSYDAINNAVLDASAQERLLAELRRDSAEATLEAALAEAKLKEEELKNKKDELTEEIETERSSINLSQLIGLKNRQTTFQNAKDLIEAEGEDASAWDRVYGDQIGDKLYYLNENNQTEEIGNYLELYEAAEKLANATTIEEYIAALEQVNTLFSDYPQLLDGIIGEASGEILKLQGEVLDANSALKQSAKKVISSKLASDFDTMKIIEDNSGLFSIASTILEESFNESGIEKVSEWIESQNYKDEAKIVMEEVSNYWDSLTSSKQQIFQQMFENPEQYSGEAIIQKLNIIDTEIQDYIRSYYEDIYTNNKERVKSLFNETFNGEQSLAQTDFLAKIEKEELITQDQADFYSSAIEQSNKYLEEGFIKQADQYLNGVSSLIDIINSLEISEYEKNELYSLMSQQDLSTWEGIQSLIKTVQETEAFKDIDISNLEKVLINLGNSLIENLTVGISSVEDKIVEKIKIINESLEDMTGELSAQDAFSAYKKMKSVDETIPAFSEVYKQSEEDPTKYILNDVEYLNKYREEQIKVLEEESQHLREKLTEAEKLQTIATIDFRKDETLDIETFKEKINEIDETSGKIYEELGIWDKIYQLYLEGSYTTEAVTSLISEKIAEERASIAALEALGADSSLASQITSNLDIGEFTEATKIAGDNSQWINYINRAKEEAYDTLLQDFLSGGVELVEEESYKYVGEVKSAANNIISSTDPIVAAKELALVAGYTIEEINEVILQATEESTKQTIGAAQDALKNLSFIDKNTAYGSLEDIETLASALEIDLDILGAVYNTNLDAYVFDTDKLGDKLNSIANQDKIILEAQLNFLNEILGHLENAFDGSLDFGNIATLSEMLGQFGIQVDESDFTRMEEGFEISRQKAFDIVYALKKIDSISAKTMIGNLAEQLEEAGSGYEDVASTMQTIAELNRELANVPVSSERRAELERELAVAEEILRIRSQDPDSFNFMDKDLPTGMQGPENYWNSVGEAYKVMNESAKSGYMEIQDYYNLITHMSQMVEAAGGEFSIGGMNAAQLIEAGMGALSNVDGEGVKVNLENLGIDILGGTEGMTEGFDDAIKEMARGQIEMLDAAIKMLETIVAMEELGNIDVDKDNQINLGEIFTFSGDPNDPTGFTGKYKHHIEQISKDLTEAGINLKQVTIAGHTLEELLTSDFDSWKQLGLSMEEHQELIDGLYQAVLSGDYDPNNISSIFETWAKNVGQEFTFTSEEFSVKVTPTGEVLSIDWTAANIEEQVKNAGFKSVDEAQSVIEKYFSGEELGQVELESALKLLGKITEKDGILTYTDSYGGTHTLPKGSENLGEEIARAEEQGLKDHLAGGKYEGNGHLRSLEIEDETSVDFLLQVNEDGTYTGFYNGTSYTGSTITDVETSIAQAIAKEAEMSAAGITFSSTPITVNGTTYTKVTLATGDTVWQDESGNTLTNEAMSQKLTEEVASQGGGEVITATTEAELEVSSVTNVSIGETAKNTEGYALTEPVKVTAAAEPLEITSVTNPTLNLGEEETIDVGEIGKVEGTASSGLEITIPEGLNADSVDLINQFNSAISAAAANATVNSGITVTITGLNKDNISQIESYNDAANSVPTGDITSSVTGDISIDAFDLFKITRLKTAVEALKANPNVNSTISAQAEGNALDVVSDIMALYGYDGQTAQLVFSALDSEGTLTAVYDQVSQITASDDTNLIYTAELIKDEIENQLAELTKDRTINITPTLVNPGDMEDPAYYIGDGTGKAYNTTTYSTYQGAQDRLEQLKVEKGDLAGNFTVELIDLATSQIDATTLTITPLDSINLSATNVTLTTNGNNGNNNNNNNNGSDNGQGAGNGGELPILDVSVITSAIQEIGDVSNTAATDINTAIGNLTSIDTSPIAQATNRMGALANAVRGIPSSGAGRINAVATAIRNLPSSKSISISYSISVSVSSSGAGTATGRIVGGSGISSFGRNSASGSLAKGNYSGKALASGTKKTLMGELGPELVVSNGRYFVVGQNGAEFVDLADDAIVFNHLQTDKLIKHGHAGTGKPVTNETKAVSLATGNVSGPAMASASEALAQLRQIRTMWQAMLDASAQDLGSKAGSGGGGGGGGGGGEDIKAVTGELERWYNLLRQIDSLEQHITLEQAKRANMLSGYNHVDSLEKELEMLKEQQKAYKLLSDLQKDYYDRRREDLLSTDYSKIFTYTEHGLMQYVDGENRGLDVLAKLNERDATGKLINNAVDAKAQIKYLQSIGFDTSILKNNEDGTQAENEEGMMENFWAGVDGWMEELDGLYDSYHEAITNFEESTEKMNEILQEYIDNQLSIEQKLLQAIQDREQAEIDRIQDEKDALEEAAQSYIDGLNDALSKEQDMYSKNETNAETQKLQRQLAILQRSGGSTSEIKSLQDQIDSRLKDAYFQEQQDQIDAIQQASDNQLEKLQNQIDIMTESLEYQKEHGLLWNEVYEMMNQWTPEQMLQFIEEYTKSYQENSTLQNEEDSKETLKELEIYAGKRDLERREAGWAEYYANAKYDEALKQEHSASAKQAYDEAFATGGASAGEAAANKVYDKALADKTAEEEKKKQEESTKKEQEIDKTIQNGSLNGGQMNVRSSASSKSKSKGVVKSGKEFVAIGYKNGWLKVKEANSTQGKIDGYMKYSGYQKYYRGIDISKLPSYSKGGDIDFTGLAMVHGSKNSPENILSAEHTKLLRQGIFSNSNHSLAATVEAIQELARNMVSSVGVNETGINIEQLSVNIQPGVISSDYDARRAGEMALEEMVKIARKTTNRVVSR